MNGGVHREHHPECRQTSGNGNGNVGITPERDSDQSGNGGEQSTPELHGRDPRGRGLPPESSQGRSRPLHDAVTDDPGAHEGTHLLEVPAQGSLQEHRQGHNKPDITGTEQEEARQGEFVDALGLGEQG